MPLPEQLTIHNHPLILLYGKEKGPAVLEDFGKALVELKNNSNFEFTPQFTQLGTNFCIIKAQLILDTGGAVPSISSLVSESFGEAAIAFFQGGI